jgi:hypothetical protein
VVELMAVCRVVLMDLRHFERSHAGCIFEIRALGEVCTEDHVLVFLVDRTTDRGALDEIVAGAFPAGRRPAIVEIARPASVADHAMAVAATLALLRDRSP